MTNVRQIQNLCAHDVCALQMRRRKTPSPAVAAARSQGLSRISATRDAKRAKLNAEASSAAAPVDSGTDPPPAGRFRRSCCSPIALVHSNGHCSCSGRRDGDWRRSCHSTSTTRREATARQVGGQIAISNVAPGQVVFRGGGAVGGQIAFQPSSSNGDLCSV